VKGYLALNTKNRISNTASTNRTLNKTIRGKYVSHSDFCGWSGSGEADTEGRFIGGEATVGIGMDQPPTAGTEGVT